MTSYLPLPKRTMCGGAKLMVVYLMILATILCEAKNTTKFTKFDQKSKTNGRKPSTLTTPRSLVPQTTTYDPIVRILERDATEFDYNLDHAKLNETLLEDLGSFMDDDVDDKIAKISPPNTGSFKAAVKNGQNSQESTTFSDGIEAWTNGLTPELRRLLDAPSPIDGGAAANGETPPATPFGMVEPNFELPPPMTADQDFVPYRGDASDPYLRPLKMQAEHQRLGRLLGELAVHNSQLLTNSPGHRNDRRSGYGLLHQRIFGDRRLGQHQNVARRIIKTVKAPAAIGPYSQAVLVDGTLYVSGQLGMSPKTGRLVEGGVRSEAIQALKNLGEILKAAGTSYGNVVKTTILLADMNDFSTVNGVYKTFFKDHFPARATFQVAGLPKKGRVEIEAVAVLGGDDGYSPDRDEPGSWIAFVNGWPRRSLLTRGERLMKQHRADDDNRANSKSDYGHKSKSPEFSATDPLDTSLLDAADIAESIADCLDACCSEPGCVCRPAPQRFRRAQKPCLMDRREMNRFVDDLLKRLADGRKEWRDTANCTATAGNVSAACLLDAETYSAAAAERRQSADVTPRNAMARIIDNNEGHRNPELPFQPPVTVAVRQILNEGLPQKSPAAEFNSKVLAKVPAPKRILGPRPPTGYGTANFLEVPNVDDVVNTNF